MLFRIPKKEFNSTIKRIEQGNRTYFIPPSIYSVPQCINHLAQIRLIQGESTEQLLILRD